ncbi:uncharacterized protein LOC142360815 isoform X3 [Opisthocomus hoazin]|uniref:uncharacterized protein LOC142360815 isoform X3 n=1 Tax=Opisthocomus hoazin TaxID=30419 RepID=UPI003F52B97C
MYGPPKPSGVWIKASGSSYCLFTLFFLGSLRVICEGSLSVLRIIANWSLTGIPALAFLKMKPLLCLAEGCFFLLPEVVQCSSAHVQQVDCEKEGGGACGREVRSCQGFLGEEEPGVGIETHSQSICRSCLDEASSLLLPGQEPAGQFAHRLPHPSAGAEQGHLGGETNEEMLFHGATSGNYTGRRHSGQTEGTQLSASVKKISFHSVEAAFRIHDSAFKLLVDS